jgi:hypothetical protein
MRRSRENATGPTAPLLDRCQLLSLMFWAMAGRATSAKRAAGTAADRTTASLASLLRRGMGRISIR